MTPTKINVLAKQALNQFKDLIKNESGPDKTDIAEAFRELFDLYEDKLMESWTLAERKKIIDDIYAKGPKDPSLALKHKDENQ